MFGTHCPPARKPGRLFASGVGYPLPTLARNGANDARLAPPAGRFSIYIPRSPGGARGLRVSELPGTASRRRKDALEGVTLAVPP